MLRLIKHGTRRIAIGTTASALAFTGVALASTAPASAAASDCPANAVCMFENRSFGGVGVFDVLGDGFPSGVCAAIASGFDNRTSSIVNNTPRNLIFYVDSGCNGDNFTVLPHSQVAYVGDRFDKKLSSAKL